jgi:hypothetical protein
LLIICFAQGARLKETVFCRLFDGRNRREIRKILSTMVELVVFFFRFSMFAMYIKNRGMKSVAYLGSIVRESEQCYNSVEFEDSSCCWFPYMWYNWQRIGGIIVAHANRGAIFAEAAK